MNTAAIDLQHPTYRVESDSIGEVGVPTTYCSSRVPMGLILRLLTSYQRTQIHFMQTQMPHSTSMATRSI
jgi:hypothetical protein